MSTNLFMAPHSNKGKCLGKGLKYKIARRFWDHDGSLSGESVVIDSGHLPYFEGLRDAGVEGADEIIKAIQMYEKVDIWISE